MLGSARTMADQHGEHMTSGAGEPDEAWRAAGAAADDGDDEPTL